MRLLKLLALAVLVLLRLPGTRKRPEPRMVPPGDPDRRAETTVILLLLVAAAAAAGFVALYVIGPANETQWLGVALALSLACIAAALIVISKRLIVTEELEEEYPPEHVEDEDKIDRLVRQSGSRFTRKRLVGAAAGGAAATLGLALAAPAVSLGPVFDVGSLYETPWWRGRRLVDDRGTPLRADDVEQGPFYTAYPEGADQDTVAAPLILIRLAREQLALPVERRGWAPGGILAYSKICTHAGCAVSLYRSPLFAPTAPKPALVCPCHYSTFDPARGGTVEFGPAGRPLPQLPLMIDPAGNLRAAGNLSAAPGPSWWGVRSQRPRS